MPNSTHQKLLESFVAKLEDRLGVKKVEISIVQLWEDKPPPKSLTDGKSLQHYMKEVSSHLYK